MSHTGLFVVAAETAEPAAAIAAIQKVLDTVAATPLAADAVAARRAQRLNSFVFQYASKAAQLSRLAVYDLYGLPQDFLQRYERGLRGVTAEDVTAAAAAHLHPAAQAIVVVGDAQQLRPALEAFGRPVVTLPL